MAFMTGAEEIIEGNGRIEMIEKNPTSCILKSVKNKERTIADRTSIADPIILDALVLHLFICPLSVGKKPSRGQSGGMRLQIESTSDVSSQ